MDVGVSGTKHDEASGTDFEASFVFLCGIERVNTRGFRQR